MIKLIGVVPTAQAQYNENGEQVSPAQYDDKSYYAISHDRIKGLTEISPDRPLPKFGSNTHYYAFTDEQDAKTQLSYDEETESFNVEFYPSEKEFKQSRQQQLDNAVVTISTGKKFDADESSITRLTNAIIAAQDEPDTLIPWSLADDGAGAMTECTQAEIREAHKLAVQNMASIWSVEQ
jgi:hypothetical protein